MARINHEEAYSFDGACTNWAESYSRAFAALRSAIITTSQEPICFAMRKKVLGAKIIAAHRTASR